jgi:6-phosphogluconolactonase
MKTYLLALSVLFAMIATTGSGQAGDKLAFYIGTATSEDVGGIFQSTIDLETGVVEQPTLATPASRTTFIWLHPSEKVLYSVAEVQDDAGKKIPAIAAWKMNPDGGRLTPINHQGAEGAGPCFVTVRADGKFAAVANYGSGSIAIYPLGPDGSIQPASGKVQHQGSGPLQSRQTGPHAHSVRFDPSGKRLLAADLGTDDLFIYDIRPDGSLWPAATPSFVNPPGSGPRHFVFSPDNRFVLSLGELSGTISVFSYQDLTSGPITTVSTVAADLPEDANRWCAEILFHPTLPVVYCSNRGPQEIALFDYEAKTGGLTRRGAVDCGGKTPRNFRLTPDGRYLLVANQDSDNIAVFKVDSTTGDLVLTDQTITVPKPMCIKFVGDHSD